jgi:hypothetical protein
LGWFNLSENPDIRRTVLAAALRFNPCARFVNSNTVSGPALTPIAIELQFVLAVVFEQDGVTATAVKAD